MKQQSFSQKNCRKMFNVIGVSLRNAADRLHGGIVRFRFFLSGFIALCIAL